MFNFSIHTLKRAGQTMVRYWSALVVLGCLSGAAMGQSWSWSFEMIDLSGRFPSLAVDANSNLHLAYATGDWALKYGFRPTGSMKWYTMDLDKQLGQFNTRLTLDSQGNPHICYTPERMKYAAWDGRSWHIQVVAQGGGQVGYNCSVAIAKDGTPHLAWYQLSGAEGNYLHIRYATLKNNAWLARTLDFDNETGKWNSMTLNELDEPLLSYSAWYNGELRIAHWNGKQWDFTSVDSRTRSHGETYVGEGNSLVLDAVGKAHISYYSEKALKYAHQVGDGWKIESVEPITWLGSWAHFRSSLVLDKQGFPHICYEDAGVLKHAFWDGNHWRIQVVARSGIETLRYSSMAIDKDDTIYIAFRDAEDNTLKLATGRLVSAQADVAPKKEAISEKPPQEN